MASPASPRRTPEAAPSRACRARETPSTRENPQNRAGNRARCLEPQLEEQLRHESAARQQRKLAQASLLASNWKARRGLSAAAFCGTDGILAFNNASRRYIVLNMPCARKYCTTCMRGWSAELQEKIVDAIGTIDPRELRHLVLTIENASPSHLHERLDQLRAAFREWRNQGRRIAHGGWWRDVEGYCWKMELDASKGRGFHPHIHVLVHAPKGLALRHGDAAREAWSRIVAARGARACHRNGIWVTRVTTRNVAREVGKYCAKPLQLENLAPSWTACVADATHGLRWHGGFGSLSVSEPRAPPGSGVHTILGPVSRYLDHLRDKEKLPDDALHAIERWTSMHPRAAEHLEHVIPQDPART